MSQTVEFEWAIGDRVRVHHDAQSAFKGLKGVVAEARQTSEHHLYKVEFDGGGDDLLRSYHLESDQAEPPTPIPIFPRVIWQEKAGGREHRIVQESFRSCSCEYLENADADGNRKWRFTPWDEDWLEEAIAAIASGATKSNGSNQNP